VRDLSAPVVIGTPAVYRGRTPRDFQALANAVPVSSRDFSRTERLLIRVPVYAPQDVAATVSARLQNRKGQSMRNLGEHRPVAGPSVSDFDLPLAGFAAG